MTLARNGTQTSSFELFLFGLLDFMMSYVIPGVCGGLFATMLLMFAKKQVGFNAFDLVFIFVFAVVTVFRNELWEEFLWLLLRRV